MQETLPARERANVEVVLLINGAPMTGDDQTWIAGERIHLENLFSNLIRNAVEASPENSTVSWELRTHADNLEFLIHNEGAIPDDIRGDFFQRYSTSGKRGGTGLGTYIASLITKAHGGEIGFESSAESGTTLKVRLPRRQPSEE